MVDSIIFKFRFCCCCLSFSNHQDLSDREFLVRRASVPSVTDIIRDGTVEMQQRAVGRQTQHRPPGPLGGADSSSSSQYYIITKLSIIITVLFTAIDSHQPILSLMKERNSKLIIDVAVQLQLFSTEWTHYYTTVLVVLLGVLFVTPSSFYRLLFDERLHFLLVVLFERCVMRRPPWKAAANTTTVLLDWLLITTRSRLCYSEY